MRRSTVVLAGALFLFGCAHEDRPVAGETYRNGSDTSGIGNNGTYGSGMTSTGNGTYVPGNAVGPNEPSTGTSSGVMEPGQPGTSNAGPAESQRPAEMRNDSSSADTNYPSLGVSSGTGDESITPSTEPRRHKKHKKHPK